MSILDDSSVDQSIVRKGMEEGRLKGLGLGREQGLELGLTQGRQLEAASLILRQVERRCHCNGLRHWPRHCSISTVLMTW